MYIVTLLFLLYCTNIYLCPMFRICLRPILNQQKEQAINCTVIRNQYLYCDAHIAHVSSDKWSPNAIPPYDPYRNKQYYNIEICARYVLKCDNNPPMNTTATRIHLREVYKHCMIKSARYTTSVTTHNGERPYIISEPLFSYSICVYINPLKLHMFKFSIFECYKFSGDGYYVNMFIYKILPVFCNFMLFRNCVWTERIRRREDLVPRWDAYRYQSYDKNHLSNHERYNDQWTVSYGHHRCGITLILGPMQGTETLAGALLAANAFSFSKEFYDKNSRHLNCNLPWEEMDYRCTESRDPETIHITNYLIYALFLICEFLYKIEITVYIYLCSNTLHMALSVCVYIIMNIQSMTIYSPYEYDNLPRHLITVCAQARNHCKVYNTSTLRMLFRWLFMSRVVTITPGILDSTEYKGDHTELHGLSPIPEEGAGRPRISRYSPTSSLASFAGATMSLLRVLLKCAKGFSPMSYWCKILLSLRWSAGHLLYVISNYAHI